MITKRKLNKKLDLLLARQALMAEVLFAAELNLEYKKKYGKKFNALWDKIMGGEKTK